MGNKFVVLAWVFANEDLMDDTMHFEEKYRGESMEEALICAFELKRDGVGCVRIEWR